MRKILLILILLAAIAFPKQSAAQVVLKTDTVDVACSSTSAFLMPVRVRNFTGIAGLQFTFQWNPAHLDYAYITNINPALDAVAFDSTNLIGQGKFTFSWTQLNSLSLPDDEILFNVAFTRIGGPATPLQFVDDPTAIFVFNSAFEEIAYSLAPGLVKPIDNGLPAISCPANVTVQGAGATVVNAIAPVASDDCGTPTIGWTSTGATIANFPTDSDASGASFNIGASTVTYLATDVAGNTTSCSFSVNVEFGIGEDLTFLSNLPPATCGQTVAIDVKAYNFDTIAAFQFSMGWDPALLQYISISNLNTTLGLSAANFGTAMTGAGQLTLAWDGPATGTSLPDGTVIFTLNATVLGAAGVTFGDIPTTRFAFSGATFPPEEIPMVTINGQFTIDDNEAPTITCPANVTVQAPGSVAVQNISPSNVQDNCATPEVGWTSSGATPASNPTDPDASGALFNQGASTVTYTATDAGGNTATCSFGVTVEFGIQSTDLTLVANSANASCGGTFSLDVTTLNFDNVAGLQFSMGWDPAQLQYNSVGNFNPALSLAISNFGEMSVNMGQLGFGWTGPLTGLSLNDGEVLFTIQFTLIGNTGGNVSFTNIPTDILAVAGPTFPPENIPVMTFAGQITIIDNVPPAITCPANVTVDAPDGSLEADVTNLQPTALSDNCGGTPTLSYSQSGATTGTGTGNANGTYSAGTTTVVYTATDGGNNTATCSFSVVVTADAPLILHLDSILTDCQGGADTQKFCITTENFTDINCLQFGLAWDTAVLKLTPPAMNAYPGLNLNAGMFFSYSTANDGLLLFFACSQTWPDIPVGDTLFCLNFDVANPNAETTISFQGPFNVVNTSFALVPLETTNGVYAAGGDNTPPAITCPTDASVSLSGTTCDATYTPEVATATDACGAVTSITRVPAGNNFNAGVTMVTYTAADQAGNTSTCTFNVTVVDAAAPVLSNCPANITVNAPVNTCTGTATWTEPTITDCSNFTVNNNFLSGDQFPAGCFPSTVTYTATDQFGNSATCEFTVLVRDVTVPTITCPADIMLFPVNSCDTVVFYNNPIATDACDPSVDVAGDTPSGSTFPAGTTTVTWVALDDCSNVSQCSFSVTVVDGAPPVMSNCPANITVVADANNCGANVPWTEPQATDICDPLVLLVGSEQPGSFFPVVSNLVVTYTATDDSGNFSTCNFQITVQDQTPPQLNNCPTAPLIVILPANDCDTVLTWTPPTASDNCSQFNLVSNFNPGHAFGTGDTMVTYVVTDVSGNKDSCSFLVSVRDKVAPVLSNCPANITVNGNGACKVPATWTEPTATDNCSIPVITSPFDPGDEFMVGTTTIQIIAEDASQNYDTCTFTVTVLGVPPGFDLATLPPNLTVTACDTLLNWPLPVAIGFCNPATVTSDPPSPTLFNPGMHIVTFTATDGTVTVTATNVITVLENIPPVMVCPTSPVEVNTGATVLSGAGFITAADTVTGCAAVRLEFEIPAATDNCAPPEVVQTTGPQSGGVFPVGSHTVTFVATDNNGNTTLCSVAINVIALEPLNPVADPNPGCIGEPVVITATSLQNATYTWTKLPGTVLNSTTNTYNGIEQLGVEDGGLYTVQADVKGCLTPLDSVLIEVIVAPEPQNDVFFISVGVLDTFNVFENDGLLDPRDYEICETSPDPLPAGITYLGNGLFTYQESGGNTVAFSYKICYCGKPGDEATVTIMVNDSTECRYLPNIITPNGDRQNDYFVIPCLDGGGYPNNSIVIYNQWGDKVFEDKGYTNDENDPSHPAWNGTLNGKTGQDLPDGVYFYIFKPSPTEPPIKGFIEIFR